MPEDRILIIAEYILVVLFCYYLLRSFSQKKDRSGTLANSLFSETFKLLGTLLMGIFRGIGWLLGAILGWLFESLSTSDLHGSAHWLRGLARRRLLSPRNKGLLLDGTKSRLSLERSFQNLIVAAPTGAGKSSKVIIPNVLALHEASAVITDPSGEVFARCAAQKAREGYTIKVLNVSDVEHSLRYNCLHYADTHTELKKVVDILVHSASPQPHSSEKFWLDSARGFIFTLLRCLKNEAETFQNIANLKFLVSSFEFDGKPLFPFISRNADELAFQDWKAFQAQDDKVIQNTLSTCKTILEPFTDPALAELTRTETLHFPTLRQQKTLLFIIVPEHEISLSTNRFLLSMLYSQLFAFAMQAPRPSDLPIFFLMDEAGHYAVPQLATIMTTCRKKRVSITLCLQDLQQLTTCYGNAEASTILNGGAQSKLFLPGLSLKTSEEIERLLGKKTVKTQQTGMRRVGGETPMIRDLEQGRSLLTAEEVRRATSS